MATADFNDFTPSEWLLLEVLAARARLGEALWTFPTYTKPTAKKLADRGLVDWKDGVIERTILVWFTETGRELWLSADYQAPADRASKSAARSAIVGAGRRRRAAIDAQRRRRGLRLLALAATAFAITRLRRRSLSRTAQ